jgi:hypothetical protein
MTASKSIDKDCQILFAQICFLCFILDMSNSFTHRLQNYSLDTQTSVYLKSLWYEASGDWETAHDMIQDLTDKHAARIHAYLHRKEGDNANASYWYARAGLQIANITPEEELELLIKEHL